MTLKAPHDYFIQFLLNLSFLDCQISYQTYRQSDASIRFPNRWVVQSNIWTVIGVSGQQK